MVDNKENIFFSSNPKDIKFLKTIVDESYSEGNAGNKFIVFYSINGILYLIYSHSYSIIIFNLLSEKKINEIKDAHACYISSFNHYLDKNNNRDLIISISADNNNLKLWNLNNLECLANIKKLNKSGFLNAACFLNQNNHIYILTSNLRISGNCEPIKVYDLNGYIIKDIKDSRNATLYMDSFYDKKFSKNFIITANVGFLNSFDFEENKKYKIYESNESDKNYKFIIDNSEEIIKLIHSNSKGAIRIWDFHTGNLLKIIHTDEMALFGICLWNNKYLFVGGKKK